MQTEDFIEFQRALIRSHVPTVAAFCLLGVSIGFSQPSPSVSGLHVITEVGQIHRLTRSQARQGYPIHVKAVVTYFEANSDLFIQDSTGSVWVRWSPDLPRPAPGQVLDLWGITTQEDFAPDIDRPRWTVIGQAPLPRAKRVTFEEMASTRVDARWVEVEGIVRSAEVTNNCCLLLNVEVPGGRVVVRIQGQPTIPVGLVDSSIRIHGACGAVFTQKNQLVGVTLRVPSMQEIKTIEPGPPDPFAPAASPIEALLRFTFTGRPAHRVKVSGTVTARFGKDLYIADPTGSVYVDASQKAPLVPGDRVEVVGFAGFVDYRVVLKDSIWRRLGANSAPVPIPIQADKALEDDSYDAALVTLDGQVTSLAILPNQEVLIVRQGATSFSAIGQWKSTDRKEAPREGSRIRLTGILVMEKDGFGMPQFFKIRMRSPEDAVVLENPSWWTRGRALSILGLVALIASLTSAWVLVLRRRVRSQTAELRRKNEELGAALKSAQEATQLKSEFLANMSHEVRTPMNAIIGMTALAMDATSREEQQEYLTDVTNSAESLLSLLNDILDLSKIEAGRMDLNPTPIALVDIVKDATHLLRTAAAQKGIELRYTVAPELFGSVAADPVRLRQVLLNLVGNAVKFTERGSVTVSAEVESQDETSICARFLVRDTGPGIPLDKQKIIFEAFRQADGSTARRYGGTGLGLAISARLVDLMGGKIWVESVPSKGSAFWFTARIGKLDTSPKPAFENLPANARA